VLRNLRIIQISMLIALVVFICLPELTHPHPKNVPSRVIFFALTGLSIWAVLGMFFLRRKVLTRAEQRLTTNLEDKAGLARWQAAHLLAFACCEALGLYGLILRFLGFGLGQVAPFYLMGVGLMLYLTPRPPLNQS